MAIVERWPFREVETRVNVMAFVERWLLEEVPLYFTFYFGFFKML